MFHHVPPCPTSDRIQNSSSMVRLVGGREARQPHGRRAPGLGGALLQTQGLQRCRGRGLEEPEGLEGPSDGAAGCGRGEARVEDVGGAGCGLDGGWAHGRGGWILDILVNLERFGIFGGNLEVHGFLPTGSCWIFSVGAGWKQWKRWCVKHCCWVSMTCPSSSEVASGRQGLHVPWFFKEPRLCIFPIWEGLIWADE